MREKFLDLLAAEIPFKTRAEIETLVSPTLVSDFQLELPRSVLEQAQKATAAFFEWRRHPDSVAAFDQEAQTRGFKNPGNYAICMSYDFHLNSKQELKLIEINTNAAFLAMSWFLYQAQGLEWPIKDFNLLELQRNIEEEISLAKSEHTRTAAGAVNGSAIGSTSGSAVGSTSGSWVIMDETPGEQKLRIEFDLFLSLFRKWGKDARIADLGEITAKDRFIYNRFTDFYFAEEKSKHLRELYNSGTCFSPHPYEYLALADKVRLQELSERPELYKSRVSVEAAAAITSVLLHSQELTAANADALWTSRKNLFFKPLRAYGGKQTYRGSSISRKAFDELIGAGILAQEYCPPSEIRQNIADPVQGSVAQDFKYDLRFYAYKDRVQGAIARLYQGQLTNMRTPHGGFACIRFV